MGQKDGSKKVHKARKIKIPNSHNGNKKNDYRWIFMIVTWTFVLSIVLNFFSSSLMNHVSLVWAFIILFFIIFLGIIFDIIGIAVASATETPFHSMASNKIAGAKQALKLIRNADKVSSFCNDVVGDISSIISGAAGATIVAEIIRINNLLNSILVGLILTGFVAALTVGGKAVGKSFAISKSNGIVYKVGILIYYFNKVFYSKRNRKARSKIRKGS